MADQADDRDQSTGQTPDGATGETPAPENAGDNVDTGAAASAPNAEMAGEPGAGAEGAASAEAGDAPGGKAAWEDAVAETEGEDADDLDESASRTASTTSTAHPADFPELGLGAPGHGPGNIDLLMDVKLPVSIELGRTTQPISEILQWGQGSIVELDKLAGEPVNLLVNNRLVAKGEVVVVDENFGLRITSLVSGRNREAQR